ncbi:Beta-sarcoglycan [Amphibalanus amphitrite]|uniref:Beta-sarcoglycan n=1 Tax=Amphibalanus amphitrite TaxID=1232801 RepID=A0A6A4VA51_AMPAM|nr:Beta-sarcoglycan [Amphibalanus amphitrite]
MQDYIVSQRRRNSAHQSMGMYAQPSNGVQTVVTTEPPESAGGGRSYAFWLLVAVVLLVAVFNLLITLTLISVLRISVGMESVQFVDGGMVLPGTVNLDRLYKPDGSFIGFDGDPMTVTGDAGQVDLLVSDTPDAGFEPAESQRVRLSPSTRDSAKASHGVRVEGVQRAAVFAAGPGSSAGGAAPFFSTDFPNFGLPDGVRSLHVQKVHTRRVVSPVDRSLKLEASTQVHLKGSEGTYIDGKEIVMSADQELHLKSVNGSVVLRAGAGVALDVRSIPWAQGRAGAADSQGAYQLCACVHFPQARPGEGAASGPAVIGRLFRVHVPAESGQLPTGERVTCGQAALHGDNNPCV